MLDSEDGNSISVPPKAGRANVSILHIKPDSWCLQEYDGKINHLVFYQKRLFIPRATHKSHSSCSASSMWTTNIFQHVFTFLEVDVKCALRLIYAHVLVYKKWCAASHLTHTCSIRVLSHGSVCLLWKLITLTQVNVTTTVNHRLFFHSEYSLQILPWLG